MAYTLEEYTPKDAISVNTWGFGPDGGRAVMTYVLHYVNGDDIEEFVKDTLGTVQRGGGYGRLQRTLPRRHPQFPQMIAVAIQEGRGKGGANREGVRATAVAARGLDELEIEPIVDEYFEWPVIFVTIEFRTVPYLVLPDIMVNGGLLSWYEPYETTPTSSSYAEEWLRFCDYDQNWQVNVAHAQQGQMVFRTGTGGLVLPDGATFSGHPKIFMPDGQFNVRWFMVPYEYVTSPNSRFVKYAWHINQFEFMGHPPGSLLFKGVRVLRRYTPHYPELIKQFPFNGVFSSEKLCDLELLFEKTARISPDAPANGGVFPNRIPAGFNLQPWLKDRQFYYIVTPDPLDQFQYPMFDSVPFELIWSDPDVA